MNQYELLFEKHNKYNYFTHDAICGQKNFKIRLEDEFLYPPFYAVMRHVCYIGIKKYDPSWTLLKIEDIKKNDCLKTFVYHPSSKINNIYAIVGKYYTSTHIVLCSKPNIKTLLNSYKNNKEYTRRKLRNMLCSTFHDTDLILQEVCNGP